MPLSDNEELRQQLNDKEYREAYADDSLNSYIAAQIRSIREQREMTQEDLANLIGTKQAGISRIENVNYSNWSIRTLKKIAYAFGCRLHVSIETFGSLLDEGASFSRHALERPKFEDDPVFAAESKAKESRAIRDRGPLDAYRASLSYITRLLAHSETEFHANELARPFIAATLQAGAFDLIRAAQGHVTQRAGKVTDLLDHYTNKLRQREKRLEIAQGSRAAGVDR
jgi:transcriptional regulator with XRE-family HTH domain